MSDAAPHDRDAQKCSESASELCRFCRTDRAWNGPQRSSLEVCRGLAPLCYGGGGGNRTRVPQQFVMGIYAHSRPFVIRPGGPRATGFRHR